MSEYINIEKNLLQTLVPVNALTEDHLDTLLRDTAMEVICPGQDIVMSPQELDKTIYLLSGQVLIQLINSENCVLDADSPLSQFPLNDFHPDVERVLAINDCLVIRFNAENLDRMLAWDQASTYIMLDINARRDLDEDAEWLMELLSSNLFYKVPPMNIRDIIDRFEPIFYQAGDTVIRQGEIGDSCYFIKEGEVEVFQAVDERFVAEPVNLLGPGRCFGEDALVNNMPRNATIVMKTNGVLMKLDKQSFFQLLKTPEVQAVSFSNVQTHSVIPPLWLDVRTQDEFEAGHYPGAVNMPLNLLKLKARMIPEDRPCIVYCNSGRRSEAATHLLAAEGYRVSVLAGGIKACNPEQQASFLERDEDALAMGMP